MVHELFRLLLDIVREKVDKNDDDIDVNVAAANDAMVREVSEQSLTPHPTHYRSIRRRSHGTWSLWLR